MDLRVLGFEKVARIHLSQEGKYWPKVVHAAPNV
jgi:hypothetical protein